jgi:hypothetical protein
MEIKGTKYKVDKIGNVYGLNGRKLKPAKDRKGYLRVGLTIDGKLCTKKVHRLIAEAFIPNPENKPQVNHINGIKDDNFVNNLEWVTHKENTKHAIDNGLFYFNSSKESINKIIKKGSLNGNALLSEEKVLEIRAIGKTKTLLEISEMYNVAFQTISMVLNRKTWKHI